MKHWKIAISGALLILLAGGAVIGVRMIERRLVLQEAEKLLSRPLPALTSSSSLLTGSGGAVASLPSEVNLLVPFTVQAPDGNWQMPYQEACEEAAALMAIRYVFGTPLLDAADADAAIKNLVETNEKTLRLPADQTAEQVMELIHAIDPKIPVALIHDPTVNVLKQQLAQGHVIIVPAAGRKLHNPFFHSPGPRYHMLVLRGYTADGYFITNDPGTKRGEGYLYPFDLLMGAMGDWNNGDPENGAKVVLAVKRME